MGVNMSINQETEAKILRLYHAEQWKIGTIATQLGIHHSTVRRVLLKAVIPKEQCSQRSMIDPYLSFILATLEKYPKLTASRLYWMVKERGYPGGPDHFRALIARYRPQKQTEAYLRLRTLPGEQGQVDWGHFGYVTLGKAKRPLMGFVMVLSYSRKIFLRFYVNARTENFLRGHEAAFRALGGVPRILLFDNLKSAVLEREGIAIRFNPSLLEFARHYHFEPRPVAIARGNEKGRVERAIRYIRDNFFAARVYSDLEDLNAQADKWCETIAVQRRCPEDHALLIQEAFLQEQDKLIKLPDCPYPVDEREAVKIGKTPYARFDLNDYSVPHTCVRKTLTVIGKPKQVIIMEGNTLVAEHERSYDRGQQIENPEHIAALVAKKRTGRQHQQQDYLMKSVANAKALLTEAAVRGYSLGAIIRQLKDLLEAYGAKQLEAAIKEALDKKVPHPNAVRIALERQREIAATPKHTNLHLQNRRLKEVSIKPHELSTYSSLYQGEKKEGEKDEQ